MDEKILNKYPEFRQFERRRKSEPVTFERRSGKDRREEPPVEIAMRLVPAPRKALSSTHNFLSGNWMYGIGMAFRFINESKEDWNDFKAAIIPSTYHDWDKQHPFWVIKDSLIEKTKIGKLLHKYDYTLFDFSIVHKALRLLGMKNYKAFGNLIKIEGSAISKVLGGAALRFPVLGAALFALMETQNIFAAKDKKKETAKAATRLVAIMGFSALCGCGGRFYGRMTEMLCMGLGIITGAKIAEKINSKY